MGYLQSKAHTIGPRWGNYKSKQRVLVAPGKKEMWGDLWRLPFPNAEKNFLWRACQEILPTKVNLYKRKVVGDPLCPICCLEEETCFHILWDCPSTRDIWSSNIKKFQKSSSWGLTFRQVVIEVIRDCDDEAISLFAVIARRIWFRRNEVIHGGLFFHPNVLVQRAKEAVEDFDAANKISLDSNVNFEKPNGESGWCSCMVALTTV
jgi:hypothetical protein